MPHLLLTPAPAPSPLHRLRLGAYRGRGDHRAYAAVTVRMEAALGYMEAFRQATGARLTVTHLVAKAVADALAARPDANVLLRWGRPSRRRRVAVCLLVLQPHPEGGRVDLTTATLADVDRMALPALVRAVEDTVARVRARRDALIEKGKRQAGRIPQALMGGALRLLSFVLYTLNLPLVALGIPADPFGSVCVTSVGSLGLEQAFVPLAPYTRLALMLAPGAVREVPVVEEGRLVPGRVLTLTATADSRLLSPGDVGALLGAVRAALEAPTRAFGAPPPGPPALSR